MTPWEIITAVLIGLSSGQLIRYLMLKEGDKIPSNRIYLKSLLVIVLFAVLVTVSIRMLNLAGDIHHMINAGVWLAIFAFVLWRTNVIKATHKTRNL